MSSQVYDLLGPEGFGAYEVDWKKGPSFRRVSQPPKSLLVPGFVDIHIHGAFGIDFMSASKDEMSTLCYKLEAEGYEAFLPTTITADFASVKKALANLPDNNMIQGFHLEGPFISPNYPGAQPKEFILNPPQTASEWDEVFNDPRLRVITMAPELPGSLELISRLLQQGVIVSMGHTNATYDEARRGYEFGAKHTTHTFNAMRPLHHREAGTVGYALANEDLDCELIYDRLHVVPEAARLLLKCKGNDHIIAVSDSSMASGMPSGIDIEMWGHKCHVGKGDVRLEDGTLAGSAITLLQAFRNLHEDFGPELAILACSVNPRRALKMTYMPRLWLEFDKNLELIGRKIMGKDY